MGLNLDVNYSFEEWSAQWYEGHKSKIEPSTQEHYRFLLKRINAYFGKLPLRAIQPLDVENFLARERANGYSDSHLSGCRGILYQIFHKAEANDYVRKNPVAYAEKMRSSQDHKEKDAFTANEVQLLMKYLPTDKFGLGIPAYYPHTAQKKYLLRRSYCHRGLYWNAAVVAYIEEKLRATWSPEQIACTPCGLKLPGWRTIYRWLYDGYLVHGNLKVLRRKGKTHGVKETRGKYNKWKSIPENLFYEMLEAISYGQICMDEWLLVWKTA